MKKFKNGKYLRKIYARNIKIKKYYYVYVSEDIVSITITTDQKWLDYITWGVLENGKRFYEFSNIDKYECDTGTLRFQLSDKDFSLLGFKVDKYDITLTFISDRFSIYG